MNNGGDKLIKNTNPPAMGKGDVIEVKFDYQYDKKDKKLNKINYYADISYYAIDELIELFGKDLNIYGNDYD